MNATHTISFFRIHWLSGCIARSFQLLSRVQVFATPWTAECQASLSITNSRNLLKLMCIESVMPSHHLILWHPLLLLPSIFHCIRVFPNEPVLHISSVTQSCLTLCDPMDCNTADFTVIDQLPEFTQTHVHWVGDAIQPSHPLASPSSPTFNLSQYQGLFQWVSSLHQVAKVLELQHQSFQCIFRTNFL